MQGCALCNIPEPNVCDQIGSQATAACVKICGIHNSLTAQICTFPRATKILHQDHGLHIPDLLDSVHSSLAYLPACLIEIRIGYFQKFQNVPRHTWESLAAHSLRTTDLVPRFA